MQEYFLLEDWSLGYIGNDPYQPPELARKVLHGKVYGHYNHRDGTHIRTSEIVRVDYDNQQIITKSGSKYKLGSINHEYEKEYPDAFNRIFKNDDPVPLTPEKEK